MLMQAKSDYWQVRSDVATKISEFIIDNLDKV